MTSFECTNSVFNITDKNNSFSISIPSHWNSEDGEDEINKFLELRSENHIELHVEEVRRRGNQIKIGDKEYLKLSDLGTRKDSIFKDLKRVTHRDLENMVCRLQITYDEIVDVLDVKYIPASTKGYTFAPGVCEVTDITRMLKTLLPKDVKVKITIDDIRLKSNLTTNKTIRFTKKIFFLCNFKFYSISFK